MASETRPSQTRGPIDLGTAACADLVGLPGKVQRTNKTYASEWNQDAADRFSPHVLQTKALQALTLVDLIGGDSPLSEAMFDSWKKSPRRHNWILLNGKPVVNLYNAATKRALKQQAKRRKSVNQLSRRANATQQQRAVQRHRDTNARGTLRASQTVEQRNAERQRDYQQYLSWPSYRQSQQSSKSSNNGNFANIRYIHSNRSNSKMLTFPSI